MDKRSLRKQGAIKMAILSIQSHVAYGHVGNAATTLPLQRLGRDVWAVHTVMFAAHAGYGPPKGPVLSSDTVRTVVAGIEERGVLPRCKAVLSGYLGDASIGEAVLDAVEKVKRANPQALYCCDPVMGDAAPGIYVREGIPDFIRTRAIPKADIATPNAFELSLLTGKATDNLESALDASRALIDMGPATVLLTSFEPVDAVLSEIGMIAVTADAAWKVTTPKRDLDPAPNGAGDLSAALFLAFMIENKDPGIALSRTASAINAVFTATEKAGTRELALIAAQDEIRDPVQSFTATRL